MARLLTAVAAGRQQKDVESRAGIDANAGDNGGSKERASSPTVPAKSDEKPSASA
jgi:hypothetical protein